MFTVLCTDVWNKVCKNVRYPASITYLCHKYFITTFSQYYISVISADILDIGIFLLPNIGISVGPKNLTSALWLNGSKSLQPC